MSKSPRKQPRYKRFKRFKASILPHKFIYEGVPIGLLLLYIQEKASVFTRILKAGTTFKVYLAAYA